tara:strand:- start:7188 stop:7352 length:165 start_codon:yes stop_codon:yes gene_type:complete
MNRREFEEYIRDRSLNKKLERECWKLYDKIYEPGSPLTYSQKANLLLGELRKIK